MKRKILKILGGFFAFLFAVVAGAVVYAQVRWDRTFEAPYPAIHASTDSAVIAKGQYLVYGPAHCAYCHTTLDKWALVDAGETPPLTGGYEWTLPFGTIRSRNLTPDVETGIGGRTDAELARMLRHGVRADGKMAMPFMSFHNMSDEDLTAIISYLRSQQPVRNPVPEHSINLLGKAIITYLMKPVGPSTTPPAASPPEAPTIERGAYLANNVADCVGCHTQRSPMDGSFIGPRFAGGTEMPLDDDPTMVLVTPNLTPDPKTGRIASWTEEQFLARFRAGKIIPQSHMPWAPYGRMSDDDLRAIYRYLMSLDPVEHDTGPVLRKAE